ncbi:hypothetical protein EMIT0P395_10656 [Pseudomonas sp. IT-P395]
MTVKKDRSLRQLLHEVTVGAAEGCDLLILLLPPGKPLQPSLVGHFSLGRWWPFGRVAVASGFSAGRWNRRRESDQ